MEALNHKIKAQEFHIGLEDQKDAYAVQNKISALQNTQINNLLNTILDRFDNPGCIYQFNTIELDLGVIRKVNYENELVYRLEEALDNYFKKAFTDNGELRVGKKIVLESRALEDFEDFLTRGYLKWNSIATKTPTLLVDELLKTHKKDLIELLSIHGGKETVRKRIIFQFQDKTLDAIVAAITGSAYEPIISHKQNIIDYQAKKQLIATPPESFRAVIWEIVLAYIFAKRRSYYDKKSFLQYLIKSVATKYNLGYDSLLSVINTGLQDDETLSDYRGEFKKIIRELSIQSEVLDISDYQHPERTNDNWISQLDHYLNFGVFKQNSGLPSRNLFNIQFKKMLLAKDPQLLSNLSNWLKRSRSRRLLASLISNELIITIVERSTLPDIKTAVTFLENLENNDGALSHESEAILYKIIQNKGEIIFDIDLASHKTEVQLIEQVLKQIFKIVTFKESTTFWFLYEINAHLTTKNQRIVASFLMKFYQNMGMIALEQIATGLLEYTNKNTSDMWLPWLVLKMPEWQRTTGLQKNKILRYVTQNLQKNGGNIEQLEFIEAAKTTDVSAYLSDSSFEEFSRSIRRSTVNTRKKQLVLHILKYGSIPWWVKDYSAEHFNEDLVKLLTTNSQKEILTLVQQSASSNSIFQIIKSETSIALWKAMDQSSGKIHTVLLQDIHAFFKSKLLPSGSITGAMLTDFEAAVFRFFLNTSDGDFRGRLQKLLKSWGVSSELYTYNSIAELFDAQLHKIKPETQLDTSINPSKEENNAEKSRVSKALHEYISNVTGIAFSEENIVQQLLSYAVSHAEHFTRLLEKQQFRETLVREAPEQELWKLIYTRIDSGKKQDFKYATFYLEQCAAHLTKQQLAAVNRLFSNMVLLKISAGGFNSWNASNWALLLIHVLKTALGKTKSQQLFIILSPAFTRSAETNDLALTIAELINTEQKQNEIPIAENSGIEEEIPYKKIGEEKTYEFMDPIFVNNAGLIILSPYLGTLFERCDLMKESRFVDDESKYRAIKLLEYAAMGSTGAEEHDLVLNKVLCGMEVNEPINRNIELEQAHLEIVDGLLTAVTQNWPGLEHTSIDSLRASFLQRQGKLEAVEENIQLQVEQKAYDLLLDRIPWNITKIKLSWMPKILEVTWR